MVFARECVSRAHSGAQGVVPFQVIVLEEHLPVSLSAREALWLFEVHEVFEVRQDGYRVGSAGEVLLPFRKGMYGREEFTIIDVIIPFSRSEDFQEVCARVHIAVSVFLHEDPPEAVREASVMTKKGLVWLGKV